MPDFGNSNPDPTRRLLHRLNGQLLEQVHQLLQAELASEWDVSHWIINVIMLRREIGQNYTARLETSATYHLGTLFDTSHDFDSTKVAGLELPVETNSSFSGYSTTMSGVVWIDDLQQLETTKLCPPEFRSVAQAYRGFSLVAVTTPASRPRSEYVFPILATPIGLQHIVLGVLNMEYFPSDRGLPSPFVGKQLMISSLLTKLLNAHAPFVLMAAVPALKAVVAREASVNTAQSADDMLGATARELMLLHKTVVEEFVATNQPTVRTRD
jgi:hypothetical protein